MREKLNFKEIITISSLLFGLFFGAGNLIFPVHMGQLAGNQVWFAIVGFVITAVTIPILGVAALGISKKENLLEMTAPIGKGYAIFFTCLCYLTIGPFFAIPRCCTTPYTIGMVPVLGESKLNLALFSLVFFAIVLFFSLKPSGILTWVGKILNPLFLIFLGILVIYALINPGTSVGNTPVDASYGNGLSAFFKGFLEGYGTLDGIASLAFGVVIVTTIQGLGVTDSEAIRNNTIKSGIFAGILMAIIYAAITVMGAQSLGYAKLSENGGIALSDISNHYFGNSGIIILALIILFACLKTAIGLVTSCSEIFMLMFPNSPGYKFWAILFTVFSFCVSNVGLTAIITYAVPVLMFIYPLGITLMLLALFGKFFNHSKYVYKWVTGLTLLAALIDFFRFLPEEIRNALNLDAVVNFAGKILPLSHLGLGWIVPAVIGLVIGLVFKQIKGRLAE